MAARIERSTEERPEVQNVILSLALLKDFGYTPIWATDKEFVESFQKGPDCPKFQQLLRFFEKQLSLFATPLDNLQTGQILETLKNDLIGTNPRNPFNFRLTQADNVARNILQMCMNDLRKPNSKALDMLFAKNCPSPGQPSTFNIDKLNPRLLSIQRNTPLDISSLNGSVTPASPSASYAQVVESGSASGSRAFPPPLYANDFRRRRRIAIRQPNYPNAGESCDEDELNSDAPTQ